MKKILSVLTCICLLLVMGISLTACGGPKVTGIKIDTKDARTSFVSGENFSTEGLKVKAVYDNKTEKDLSNDKVTAQAAKGETKVAVNEKFSEVGSYTVTVSYEYEKDKFFKDNYSVIVTHLNEEDRVALVNNEEELKKAIEHYSAAKLNNNIVLTDTIPLSKEFVLDLNGHTISNETEIWQKTNENNWSLISVKNGGNLTINGNGNLNAKENDCYAIDVNGGQLNINGGNFKGNVCAVYVYSGTLTVNGGDFDVAQLSQHNDKRFLLNCFDENYKNNTAQIVVKGGTFHGFNPANDKSEALGGGIDFVADGFYSEENEGVFTVKAYQDENVHVKTEEALRDALTAKKTQTVVLDKDITFTRFIQLEGADCQITLDLNGHNLTANGNSNTGIWIVSSAKLTVKNSKNTGKYNCQSQVASFNVGSQYFLEESRAGTLVIENGDFQSIGEVVLLNNGKAEIKGGKFNSTGSRHWALNIYDKAKDNAQINFEVSGGEYTNFNPASPNTNDKSTYIKSGFKSQLKGGNRNIYEVVAE